MHLVDRSSTTRTHLATRQLCRQHETDYIKGVVYRDRLPTLKRKQLFRDHDEVSDQYTADWPACQATNRLGGRIR